MDENSPLTSSATAEPRGVIAGWPPAPRPRCPGPSIAYPPHPTKQTRNPTPQPSFLRRQESIPSSIPPVGAALVAALPSPRVISPLPPAPYLLYPHTLLSPPVIPAEIADAESAPTAYAYRVPRGPNPPRETKQSTIVPAPPKQSTPKLISLIDPPHPPPRHSCGGRNPSLLNAHPPPPHPPSSFLQRQESIPPECPPPAEPAPPLVIPAPEPASIPPPTPIQVLNLLPFNPLFPLTYSVILSPVAFGRISTLHPTHGPRHHGPQDTAIARRFVRPIRLSTGLAGP